jgi:hypothetical protein
MSEQLKCLFVTASTSACAGEVKLVQACLHNLGIAFREVEWLSQEDFITQTADGRKYDFIYLGAHADSIGFGEKDGAALYGWDTLGIAICATDCILPGGTLFLGCCRGGMKTVALKILKTCDRIDYICGPHWKVTGNDLTNAFQAFVNSRISKKEEPCRAAERATDACGFRFSCYDRQELQAEIETLRQIQNIEWQMQEFRTAQTKMNDQLALIAKSLDKAVVSPISSPQTSPEADLAKECPYG